MTDTKFVGRHYFNDLCAAAQDAKAIPYLQTPSGSLGTVAASFVTEYFVGNPDIQREDFRSAILHAFPRVDVRMLAVVLHMAVSDGVSAALNLLEQIALNWRKSYASVLHTLLASDAAGLQEMVIPAPVSLDHVLDATIDREAVEIWTADNGLNDMLVDASRAAGGMSRYLHACFDLVGPAYRARSGLVKLVPLSSDFFVVVKRTNPSKPGRLRLDIENAMKVASLLEQVGDEAEKYDGDRTHPQVRVITPSAVIRTSADDELYAISSFCEGDTVEELLARSFGDREQPGRRATLADLRQILDMLYSKGIVWGDFAPRNIIVTVDPTSGARIYNLLDFEKTYFTAKAVSLDERIQHGRGPMYVEEFGAVCLLDEVTDVFSDYFDPGSWDVTSQSDIRLTKPKREVIDILKAANNPPTWGAYNRLEERLLSVRFSTMDASGRGLRPVITSFMIDHLIGNEADRLTTELMLVAHEVGALRAVVDVLDGHIALIENEISREAMTSILVSAKNSEGTKARLQVVLRALSSSIETLHACQSRSQFDKTLAGLFFTIARLTAWQTGARDADQPFVYSALIAEPLRALLTECQTLHSLDIAAVSGSSSRREATFASDVEVFLIGDNWSAAEKWLAAEAKARLGIDIDMYAVTQLHEMLPFLRELPDYFIDFFNVSIVAEEGNQSLVFRHVVEAVISVPGFLRAVVKKRRAPIACLPHDRDDAFALVKRILNAWGTFEAVSHAADIPNPLLTSSVLKSNLLHHKSQIEVSTASDLDVVQWEYLQTAIGHACSVLSEAEAQLLAAMKPAEYYLPELSVDHRTAYREEVADAISGLRALLGFDTSDAGAKTLEPTIAEILPTSLQPICRQLVSFGEGAAFSFSSGESCIDLTSMTVNCILGQNDPWVVVRQLSQLTDRSPSFLPSRLASATYRDTLAALRDARLGGIARPIISLRQCNGSDAVELALKVAYTLRGDRQKIVSFRGSYHGQNLAAYSVSDTQSGHRFFDCAPEVEWLEAPSSKKVWKVAGVLDDRPLDDHERQIIAHFESVATDAYAIIVEPVQCNNGLRTFSLSLMKALRRIAADFSICFIVDEVQTGFGWFGAPTASEVYGIVPDAMCLAKAVTAGYGSAAITIWDGPRWDVLPYGTAEKTNGGNPLAYVAIQSVYERMFGVESQHIPCDVFSDEYEVELRQGLNSRFSKTAKFIESCFHDLLCDFPGLIEHAVGFGLIRGLTMRGRDSMSAVDVAGRVVELALAKGALIRRSGDAILIKPPAVITMTEVFLGFRRVKAALTDFQRQCIAE